MAGINLDKQNSDGLMNLLLMVLWVGIFIMFIIGFYSIKFLNGDRCGADIIDNYQSSNLVVSSFDLNNNNGALKQLFVVEDVNDVISYEMCFKVNVTTTNGILISIVNNNVEVAQTFVYQQREDYCVGLDKDVIVKGNNYLGVECDLCNNNNRIIFYEDVSKTDRIRLYDNMGFSVTEGNMVSISLKSLTDCSSFIMYLFKYYLIFIVFILVGILIMFGLGWIKDFLFNQFSAK